MPDIGIVIVTYNSHADIGACLDAAGQSGAEIVVVDNASTDETLECVLVRSDNEAVVVNLDIEAVEKPEAVFWVDPIHKHPA